ncbi:MAG: post-COAP-1 domain-containing protein, partial [Limisphaerales bacterium]
MKTLTRFILSTTSLLVTAAALHGGSLNLPSTPVLYYADGGDLDAFFHVTLSNVPNGFSVQNDLYPGWCVTLNAPASPTGANHAALLLDSTSSNLPSPLNAIHWDLVNYVLNHKQGDADEVQSAIWLITDSSTILPITANVQAMITDALDNGTGFTPADGQIAAAILVVTDDPSIQTIVIEALTPTATNECEDRFTSGGFIYTTSGAKGTFGCHAGILNGAFWAGLNYIDHGTGLHVKGKTLINYEVIDAVTRRATFIADADGVAVIAVVTVADNGEPGSKDTFRIVLSNGYSQGGRLGSTVKNGGGNIQLHKPKCKKG